MKKLLLLAIFCLPSLFVLGQTEEKKHPIDQRLSECMEKDYSTAGMRICTSKAHDEWDALLNKNYKFLRKTLDSKSSAALKKAQLAWLKYRDAEYELLDAYYSQKDGTMYLVIHNAGVTEIVKKRALELQEYVDMLEY